MTENTETEKQQTSLKEAGIYLLSDGFNSKTAAPIITWILEENLSKKPKPHLTLMINSPGGHLTDCFAIIDTMNGSKIPIYTVGIGMIASCGLLAFMNGAKGHRILTPNTAILSHQYSWGTWGKHHELLASTKEFDHTKERILNHYKRCTNLSIKDINKYLLPPEDVWLSAEEAKKFGICDDIKTL